MENNNKDLNKLTKLEYDKMPKFMRGVIGKKYGFNSLSRDIVGFLRNRLSVSVKNGLKDNGRYYVKASSKEMCDEFITTNKTLDKALKILEDVGYISSKKGFNSSKKYFINFEIEARLNEEYLQWKENNKNDSLGKTPILYEPSNDNSLGNSPSQFRKNSYLERSTLERPLKDIKTYTSVLEIVNTFRCDYVHLENMEDQEIQEYAGKWDKAFQPGKGANLKTFIRNCMEDLNDRLDGGTMAEDSFNERYVEEQRSKQSALRVNGHSGSIGRKKKYNRTELVSEGFNVNDKEKPSSPEALEKLAKIKESYKPTEEPQAQTHPLKQEKVVNEENAAEKQLLNTYSGYEESYIMPEGSHNPFTGTSEEEESNCIDNEEKQHMSEFEAFKEYGEMNIQPINMDFDDSMVPPEKEEIKPITEPAKQIPRLNLKQLTKLSKLVGKAKKGDKEVRKQCESPEMQVFVEIGKYGQIKVRDEIITNVKQDAASNINSSVKTTQLDKSADKPSNNNSLGKTMIPGENELSSDQLSEEIKKSGYENKNVVESVMNLANKGDQSANEHVKELQKRKCLFNGKNGVTYTAEYNDYVNSGSDMPFEDFLNSYNPIMSNGKELVVQ